MKKYLTSFGLALILCLPLPVLAAAPTITNVSSPVATGQILTITGTNMVQESTANWDAFFIKNTNASSFEGVNPTADGYGAIGVTGGSYDNTVKLLGNKSMKFSISGAMQPPGNLTDYNGINPEGGDNADLWIRFYARWNLTGGGWPTSHIKLIDSQGGGALNQFYFQPKQDGAGNLPTQFDAVWNEGKGNASHYVNIPSGQLQNNRWYGIELHWKNTGGNVFAAWIDGTQVVNAVPPLSNYTVNFILLGFINASGTNSSFALDHWWDGFAISTTRVGLASLIEIGNCLTYGSGTRRYQVPEFLSDTSSQVRVNLSGLGPGPYVLWVTNNQNERVSFSGGALGSGTPTCSGATPNAPANLKVQ